MSNPSMWSACRLLAALFLLASGVNAKPGEADPEAEALARNDVRTVRVGMSVKELAAARYSDLRCASDVEQALGRWEDFALCRPEADGTYRVHFSFSEASNVLAPLDGKYRGTKVGGHPVVLTLTIGPQEQVVGLDMKTDPHARVFQRKKAFLFGQQAMDYYGSAGWSCQRSKPVADEMPIGETFIKEHCEKDLAQRHLVVDRRLYRHANDKIENLVSDSEVSVRWMQRRASR